MESGFGRALRRLRTERGLSLRQLARLVPSSAGYLGQLDKLCGVPVTTRNWNTITSIAKILKT